MSVAHLRPYPGWDSFVGLISGALDAYWSVAKPAGYLRVGLRYINRIALPGTRIELEEYFDFYPFVGKRLPQDQTGFLVSIHIPYEEGRDLLRLQLGSADPEQEQALAFVLDLDYFLSQPEAVAPADVMGWLGDAHARIKDAFAGSIKPLLWQRFAGEDAEA